jgi:hypothetical protein
MKTHAITITCLFLFTVSAFTQKTETIDLHKLVKNKGIEAFNRELTLINEGAYKGVRLSKDEGEGVAWLKGIEFADGTIEFDVRGEDVKNHSFVGLAFHGKDNATFDAIYLRPFRFKDQTEELRSHGIQYISLPDFPWRTLREKFPNKFENSVNPAPDPNSWNKVRIVINGSKVTTYVNGNKQPSLEIEKVTNVTTGSIGFYVADTSGGDFANITITKSK